MPAEPKNLSEATNARDWLYSASARGRFPMSNIIEHDIESAYHKGDYPLLHAYVRLLTDQHMTWLIHDAVNTMKDMQQEHPEAALTAEHLEAHKQVCDAVIETFGNTPDSRDLSRDLSVLAFTDLGTAPLIADIVRQRKLSRVHDIEAALDNMRDIHSSLAEGVL